MEREVEGTTGGQSLNASSRAVRRNAVMGYATLGLGALLGFVATPILLKELGVNAFGIWVLALGALNYLALLEAGLGIAITTRVAAREADGVRALGEILSSGLALFSFLAVLQMVAAVAFSFAFPQIFDVPQQLEDDARYVVVVLGAWQSILFVANVCIATLNGLGRMYLLNIFGFSVTALVTVVQVIVVLSGGSLRNLAQITLLGGLLTLISHFWLVHHHLPGAFRWSAIKRSVVYRLLSLGWRNAVSSAASTLAFGSDVLLVGLVLGPAEAAAYALALRAYALLQRLSAGVLGVIGPVHTHASVHRSDDARFTIYVRGVALSLFLAGGMAVPVAVFAPVLLEMWLGEVPEYTEAVLLVLCGALLLSAPGSHAYTLLLSSERASEVMRVTSAASVLNVTASVSLTLVLGPIGPALGTLITISVVDAVYLPRRVARTLGRSGGEVARRVMRPLIMPLASLAVGVVGSRLLFGDGAAALIGLALCVAGYVVIAEVTVGVRGLWSGLLDRDTTSDPHLTTT